MKQDNFTSHVVKWFFYFFILILFMVNMQQLNNIEKRMIEINGRLQKIDETSNELANTIRKLQEGGTPGGDSNGTGTVTGTPAPEKSPAQGAGKTKWLHPEVKNFLGDETFVIREKDAKIGGALSRWYGSDPKGFNAYTQNDGELRNYVGAYVNMEGFATRSRQDPNKWVKMLAERIEITDDYKEYTVYLKKGVKWHKPVVDWSNPRYNWLKGDHYVTTKDVKFSIDVILNNQVECPHLRNYYVDLESVKIIDDYTIVIRWKKKTYNSISFTIELNPIPEFLYAYDEDGTPFPRETS